MKRVIRVLVVLCLLVLLYGGVSIWGSANFLIERKFSVDTGKCQEEFVAVVISDLHDHEFGNGNVRLVEKIQDIAPDLILMDGDMLNETSDDAEVPLNLIRQLKDTAPVYYALGNHEINYMENGHPQLMEELENAGAVMLEREFVDIEVKGNPIRIGGMYEYAFGLNGNNDALSAPSETLAFLQEFQDTDHLKIMMAHRPDSFIFGDASKVWNIDLVISGHNHGGQVVIPFLGGLYGGDQGWFPEYVHGLYKKDKLQMFVTSGLGTHHERLPRFNNPPEIAVLTIR
nr:metallophosphoesterase [uncultured Merdimonas sp.]